MKIKKSICAFLFTVAVLLLGFYIGSMFPFGEGTISWCDMNQQGIPLLCDFKDILEGKDGIFLNLQNASGMNFYGVFFFFLASPFSFLCVFVDKVDIPFLINILVVLKLALSASTASVYFSKKFEKLDFFQNVALSMAYGLCGYGMLFFQNIMWLDIMYMLPILMLGIHNLMFERKPVLFTVALTISLIMNYYIGYMVILFVILYFGVYSARYKFEDKALFLNLGVGTLSALMMSAVVIIPSFLQYTSSARGSDIIDGLINSDFFGSTYTTFPVVMCSALIFAVLLLAIPKLYYAKRNLKTDFIIFILLFLPLFLEPINLMWHTGHYMSFPARFAFLTIFIGLCIVAHKLSQWKGPEKSDWLFLLVTVALLIIFGYVMIWYTNSNLHVLTAYVTTLWGDKASFRGLLILFFFSIAAYLVLIVSFKKSYITKRVFSVFLCLIVCVEGICSVKVYMNSADGKFNYENYRSFMALEDSVDDTEFFRVNMKKKYIDANMTGASGFNSIGHYTSLNDSGAMKAAKQLGYSGYWMETGNWGGSILSDALMSVKYTVEYKYGEYVLSENPYYLGAGIKVNSSLPEEIADGNRLEKIGSAFSKVTGCVNPVISYSPTSENGCSLYYHSKYCQVNQYENNASLSYQIHVEGKQHLYFDCYNGFSNRLNETINKSLAVLVNGVTVSNSYPAQTDNGLLYLGEFENCEVEVIALVSENIDCISFGLFGVRDDVVKNAVANATTINMFDNGGSLVGEVTGAGEYFISVPYNDGLKVTLNGEEAEFKKALTGYISVNLKNAGTLKVSLVPKGFYAGLIITILGILLCVFYIIYLMPRIKNDSHICTAFKIMFTAVFIMMILVIYVLPICLNLFG